MCIAQYRRTYNLDTALKGLVVGPGANKGWQEGVMNVDCVVGMPLAKVI